MLLKDKNILIMGIRNKWSIAYGIALESFRQGANLILTAQSEREKNDIEKLLSEANVNAEIYLCDVSDDGSIDILYKSLEQKYKLDGIVHSIAHAKTEDLQNDFIYTSRDGFLHAMNISAYSLVAVCAKLLPILNEGASIITLSYDGANRVFKGYNVMGVAKAALEASVRYLAYDLGKKNIRINTISAGPVKTMSARGIKNFSTILDEYENKAPLNRNVTLSDIAGAAIFLLSNLSSGITGELLYVDCGYNIMGV